MNYIRSLIVSMISVPFTGLSQPITIDTGTADLMIDMSLSPSSAGNPPVTVCDECSNNPTYFNNQTYVFTDDSDDTISDSVECDVFMTMSNTALYWFDHDVLDKSFELYAESYGTVPQAYQCVVDSEIQADIEVLITAVTDVLITGTVSAVGLIDPGGVLRANSFMELKSGVVTLAAAPGVGGQTIVPFSCRIPAGQSFRFIGETQSSAHGGGEDYSPIPQGNAVTFSHCNYETICIPDVNEDGEVNAADFTAWIAAFNASDPKADQNGDCEIDAADFSAFVANLSRGCSWL